MNDIVYFTLNNWFSGRDYPGIEPIKTWVEDYQFKDDEWVKENKLVVVCGPIDMSMNYCIAAPKEWVEENCSWLLGDEEYTYKIHHYQASHEPPNWYTEEVCKPSNFVKYPDFEEGEVEGQYGMDFMEYCEENIGVHWDNSYWDMEDTENYE